MKTEILAIKGSWQEVVDDCRSTVGKESLGHEPSSDFKRRILFSEHSPIRDIRIRWHWTNIPSWVATHWSRHKWECYILSQRRDRVGPGTLAGDRGKLSQDAAVNFTGDANVQNLIDTWRKRLCYQASPETREYAEDFKRALHKVEPEISDVLVPNCVFRCGCPEMNCCGFFNKLMEEEPEVVSTNIAKRYNAYNRWFWKHKGGKKEE